jgi:hypothetical protein
MGGLHKHSDKGRWKQAIHDLAVANCNRPHRYIKQDWPEKLSHISKRGVGYKILPCFHEASYWKSYRVILLCPLFQLISGQRDIERTNYT